MDRRYVGIDLHRRRSVIYAMDAEGEQLFCERIDNDSLRLLEVVSGAGDGAEVVIEATYGWYCLDVKDLTDEEIAACGREMGVCGWCQVADQVLNEDELNRLCEKRLPNRLHRGWRVRR